MPKANHALTMSERAAPTRRALLCTAPVALAATLPEIPLLGPLLPAAPEIPVAGNDRAISELAEIKRLIAELIAIDDEQSAAENAQDTERVSAAEADHERLYTRFREFAYEVQTKPPRGWLDIVIRAEIDAYDLCDLWKKPRSDWDSFVDAIDNQPCEFARAKTALTVAVLWLADREGGHAHV